MNHRCDQGFSNSSGSYSLVDKAAGMDKQTSKVK